MQELETFCTNTQPTRRYHGERRYWSFVEMNVFVKMSAYGICLIFKKLKIFLCISLRCPRLVLLPRSTASRSESLFVLPMISGGLIRRSSSISAIRILAFTAEDHSIASASPHHVAVVACPLHFHSTKYVLLICPASTINLPASLRREAQLESLSMKIKTSSNHVSQDVTWAVTNPFSDIVPHE